MLFEQINFFKNQCGLDAIAHKATFAATIGSGYRMEAISFVKKVVNYIF